MTETPISYLSLCRQHAASAEEQSAAQRQSGKAHKSESASPLGAQLNPECVFLRDTDLAMRYRVQRQTLWRWVAQGKFPAPAKLSGRCTRWRLSAILEWEQSRGGAA